MSKNFPALYPFLFILFQILSVLWTNAWCAQHRVPCTEEYGQLKLVRPPFIYVHIYMFRQQEVKVTVIWKTSLFTMLEEIVSTLSTLQLAPHCTWKLPLWNQRLSGLTPSINKLVCFSYVIFELALFFSLWRTCNQYIQCQFELYYV